MNIRKISLLFLAVVGISLIMVSIMPMSVFAGTPPTGKEQYDYTDKKTKKVENPHQSTIQPVLPLRQKFPHLQILLRPQKFLQPLKLPTDTKVPTLIPSSTPTLIVPYIPPKTNLYPSSMLRQRSH